MMHRATVPAFRRLIPALWISLIVLGPTGSGNASPLADISRSQEYRDVNRGLRFSRPIPDGGRNYRRLFTERNGLELLTSWIGTAANGFTAYPANAEMKLVFAQSIRNYVSRRNGQPIQLTIFVPTSRIRDSLRLGVAPETSRFEPPLMPVSRSEERKIHDLRAMLYFTPGGGCSLLFRSAQETRVQLRSNVCQDPEELVAMAQQLDIRRLFAKLAS